MKHNLRRKTHAGADQTTSQTKAAARRRLFTGGMIAGSTIPFLPATWTAPVVQTVLLPAHAQTTADGSASQCLDTDTISGRSFDCSDNATCIRFLYALEAGCLTRSLGDCGGSLPSNGVQLEFTILGASIVIEVATTGVQSFSSASCTTPQADFESAQQQFALEVDGQQYTATFTVGSTETPPTVFVSNITVAPD